MGNAIVRSEQDIWSDVRLQGEKWIASNAARRLVQLALAQQAQVQKGEQLSALLGCDSPVD
jgi:hypothetical protein